MRNDSVLAEPSIVSLNQAQIRVLQRLQALSVECGECDPEILKVLSDWDVWYTTQDQGFSPEFQVPIDPKQYPKELAAHLATKELAIIMGALESAAKRLSGN